MDEFELLERLAPYLDHSGHDLPVGYGDDAAVVEVAGTPVALAVDALVEGVHWDDALSRPGDVGWKAIAVNLSDLAAMGATPVAAVVALARPVGVSVSDLEELYGGLREACDRWAVQLVGGDTVAADQLMVSVTVVGRFEQAPPVRRGGAQPGDELVVVGRLGATAAVLAQHRSGTQPDVELLAAHRRPQPLVAAGRALAERGARAMIDISDGLGADLAHVCHASQVRARVRYDQLPVFGQVAAIASATGQDGVALVCGGGDDYALLAAVPSPDAVACAAAAAEAEGVPAAVVGQVLAPTPGQPAVVLELPDGEERDLSGLGWQHFREAEPS